MLGAKSEEVKKSHLVEIPEEISYWEIRLACQEVGRIAASLWKVTPARAPLLPPRPPSVPQRPPNTPWALLLWSIDHLGSQEWAECAILKQLSAACKNGNLEQKVQQAMVLGRVAGRIDVQKGSGQLREGGIL